MDAASADNAADVTAETNHWRFEFIFKPKRKVESGNPNIQYGYQATIVIMTSLKMNRLLSVATINMNMNFEIEIRKQTWLMPRKPCRLQMDWQTDGHVIPLYPSNFVGRVIGRVYINKSTHENIIAWYTEASTFWLTHPIPFLPCELNAAHFLTPSCGGLIDR